MDHVHFSFLWTYGLPSLISNTTDHNYYNGLDRQDTDVGVELMTQPLIVTPSTNLDVKLLIYLTIYSICNIIYIIRISYISYNIYTHC